MPEVRNDEIEQLVYGYNSERNTFHLYLAPDGLFVHVTYHPSDRVTAEVPSQGTLETITEIRQAVPNKRVYREKSDAEFCDLLARKFGTPIPYAAARPTETSPRFHGLVLGSAREILAMHGS